MRIVCCKQYINNSNGISDSVFVFCPARFSLWDEYISDAGSGLFFLLHKAAWNYTWLERERGMFGSNIDTVNEQNVILI